MTVPCRYGMQGSKGVIGGGNREHNHCAGSRLCAQAGGANHSVANSTAFLVLRLAHCLRIAPLPRPRTSLIIRPPLVARCV